MPWTTIHEPADEAEGAQDDPEPARRQVGRAGSSRRPRPHVAGQHEQERERRPRSRRRSGRPPAAAGSCRSGSAGGRGRRPGRRRPRRRGHRAPPPSADGQAPEAPGGSWLGGRRAVAPAVQVAADDDQDDDRGEDRQQDVAAGPARRLLPSALRQSRRAASGPTDAGTAVAGRRRCAPTAPADGARCGAIEALAAGVGVGVGQRRSATTVNVHCFRSMSPSAADVVVDLTM